MSDAESYGSWRGPLFGGVARPFRSAVAVQSKGHAIGRAARKQERRKVDLYDVVAARFEPGPQRFRRLRHDHPGTQIDGIDAERSGVFCRSFDAMRFGNARADRRKRSRRESVRIVEDVAAGQWTEAGVEVIEAFGRE